MTSAHAELNFAHVALATPKAEPILTCSATINPVGSQEGLMVTRRSAGGPAFGVGPGPGSSGVAPRMAARGARGWIAKQAASGALARAVPRLATRGSLRNQIYKYVFTLAFHAARARVVAKYSKSFGRVPARGGKPSVSSLLDFAFGLARLGK